METVSQKQETRWHTVGFRMSESEYQDFLEDTINLSVKRKTKINMSDLLRELISDWRQKQL